MSASGSARLKLLQHLQSLEHIRLDGLRFRLIDAKDQVRTPVCGHVRAHALVQARVRLRACARARV